MEIEKDTLRCMRGMHYVFCLYRTVGGNDAGIVIFFLNIYHRAVFVYRTLRPINMLSQFLNIAQRVILALPFYFKSCSNRKRNLSGTRLNRACPRFFCRFKFIFNPFSVLLIGRKQVPRNVAVVTVYTEPAYVLLYKVNGRTSRGYYRSNGFCIVFRFYCIKPFLYRYIKVSRAVA